MLGFWDESGPQNGVVLGLWGESGPQNAIVLGFWGESGPQNAVVFILACLNQTSSTQRPSLSSKLKTEPCYLTVFPLPLWTVSFYKHPQEQTPVLSNTQTEANVTPSLAPVDRTAQGTKKPPTKEKGEFTFPFSSVILNFLWVDIMIGLRLWNILTFVDELAKCGQS